MKTVNKELNEEACNLANYLIEGINKAEPDQQILLVALSITVGKAIDTLVRDERHDEALEDFTSNVRDVLSAIAKSRVKASRAQ